MRLAAGIAQTGRARDGADVTIWPRDERTGLYQVTVHEPGKAQVLLGTHTVISDALRAGIAEVHRRGGHA